MISQTGVVRDADRHMHSHPIETLDSYEPKIVMFVSRMLLQVV